MSKKASKPTASTDLHDHERELLRVMQSMGFGRVLHLQIRNGLPVLNPPPQIVRVIKLNSESPPIRPAMATFALRQEVAEFFGFTRSLVSSTLRVIEVRHGSP